MDLLKRKSKVSRFVIIGLYRCLFHAYLSDNFFAITEQLVEYIALVMKGMPGRSMYTVDSTHGNNKAAVCPRSNDMILEMG
jgi:hypothetical protein